MTTKDITTDLHARNRMLADAANVLGKAGRGRSATILRRHRRPDLADGPAQTALGVRARFLAPTPGYQIAERLSLAPAAISSQQDIIGIVGPTTARLLRHRVIDAALPYDGHDRALFDRAPRFLMIEADALADRFGWQHALTLRDPAATAELVTMVQKARSVGIVTVLVRPAEAHRFPLLSRVLEVFDHVIAKAADIRQIQPT